MAEITVATSIPVLVTITGVSVYANPQLGIPATFPAAISGDTDWFTRDGTAHVTVTDPGGTVTIIDEPLYAYRHATSRFDVGLRLTPAMVALLNAAPHTWASE